MAYPQSALQRVTPYAATAVGGLAGGMERRQHAGLIILSRQTISTLNRNEIYLWLVRRDVAGTGWEFVVARQGEDRIGHPTLAWVGDPGVGAFRSILIGGTMRYSHGWGWILDNESGRFGRAPRTTGAQRATETSSNFQLALQVFQQSTGQVATADQLSGYQMLMNFQLFRRNWRNWGGDYLRAPSLRTTATVATVAGLAALHVLGGSVSELQSA
jgi:hypothetical protein